MKRMNNSELREVRANVDWRSLFEALGIRKDERKSRVEDWWGYSPFSPEEDTASFHMNDKGWYCHSTGKGGGPVELVQSLEGCNCYEAGRWLLEHGVSHLQAATRSRARKATAAEESAAPSDAGEAVPRSEGKKENAPVRQDMRPLLRPEHPLLAERGITREVLEELGVGYYPGSERSRSPLKGRLIFQIRGVRRNAEGELEAVVLSHIGRATTEEQAQLGGKWHFYAGFHASVELYNQDMVLLDSRARQQARETGHVVVVEGCFDVAKLVTAGIRNVVASFGGHVSEDQAPRLRMIADELGMERFLVFFDRDQDGSQPNRQGTKRAVEVLEGAGLTVAAFDWGQEFLDRQRGNRSIPKGIGDPCDFTVEQLAWMRSRGVI